MSYKIRLLIILYVIIFLFAGCNNDNKVVTVEDFSLYLVKDLTTAEAMSKDLDDLLLESTPLLTDKEIRTYEWEEHVFTLIEGFSLEEKLDGKVPVSGKPFVVVVGSERIYMGSFWTPISSLFNPDIPIINSMWFKGNDEDTYRIAFRNEQDPRGDIRILESLKGLGKIIDE